jgi:DNA-binding NarL/FixJ family response regulator
MLSEREAEVLALLRAAHTTNEMAQRLAISPTTVRRHVSEILRKLQVADRAAAVRLASTPPK